MRLTWHLNSFPRLILTSIGSLHLNDNALTGLLPSQIGLLSRLQELQLHTNRFIGSIPNEIGNLVNISKYLNRT